MMTGIPCPRCKSLNIKATRKPYRLLTDRLSLRLWECTNCETRFMMANVVVKDETADRLEEIYDKESTERVL